MKTKTHGWLTGALADVGYKQCDLAKAWEVDDAVVSRFISSGKPDLTPKRITTLAQMMRMTSDQLLARLNGGGAIGRAVPSEPQPRHASTPATPPHSDSIEATLADAQRAVQRLKSLLPGARIHFSINYNSNCSEERYVFQSGI